ncbi:2489_t:CDS:2, partial [Entrophospora sp. SA101]
EVVAPLKPMEVFELLKIIYEEENGGNEDIEIINANLPSLSIINEENHDANFLGEFACGTTVACVPNTDSIHDEDGDSILIYDELVVINERLGPWSGYEHLLLLKSVLERK